MSTDLEKESAIQHCSTTKRNETKKKFDKSEVMMKLKCEVHNWMNTYAGVVDNPFLMFLMQMELSL